MILRLLLANESTMKGIIRVNTPKNGQNGRNLGGGAKKNRRTLGGRGENSIFDDTNVFLDPKRVHFKVKTSIFTMNKILPGPWFKNILNPPLFVGLL